MIYHSFSPKMYRNNFEYRFTNKKSKSKNMFEDGFLHGEIVARKVTIFPEKKIKVLKILYKIHKTNTKL